MNHKVALLFAAAVTVGCVEPTPLANGSHKRSAAAGATTMPSRQALLDAAAKRELDRNCFGGSPAQGDVRASTSPTTASSIEPYDEPQISWREFVPISSPLTRPPNVSVMTIDEKSARVRVTNVGQSTLNYSARGSEGIQYFIEEKVNGQWKTGGWDWCGTGMSTFKILPGESTTVVVRFAGKERPERVLGLFEEEGTDRLGFVVLATWPADQ